MRVLSGRFKPLPDSCCPDLKQVPPCLSMPCLSSHADIAAACEPQNRP